MNAKDRKRRDRDDLAAILESKAGRRFIQRLVDILDNNPVRGDTHTTYYQLGVMDTARWLLNEVKRDHFDMYKLMLSEVNAEDEDSTCNTNPGE